MIRSAKTSAGDPGRKPPPGYRLGRLDAPSFFLIRVVNRGDMCPRFQAHYASEHEENGALTGAVVFLLEVNANTPADRQQQKIFTPFLQTVQIRKIIFGLMLRP
jgi:hypothetical protein